MELRRVLFRSALVFDNLEKKIKVIANAVIEKGDKPAEIYKKAIKKIDALVKRLRTINPAISKAKKSVGKSCSTEVTSNFSKKGFIEGVLKAKEYIQAGDIIQVVLSQRFETGMDVEPFDIYRGLTVIKSSLSLFFI